MYRVVHSSIGWVNGAKSLDSRKFQPHITPLETGKVCTCAGLFDRFLTAEPLLTP